MFYLNNVMNKRHAEIPIEFYRLIAEYIFQRSLWTVFRQYQYSWTRRANTCPDKSRRKK